MNINKFIVFSIIFFTISCTSPQPVEVQNDIDTLAEPTAKNTMAPTNDSEEKLLELPTPIVGTVALDFSERPCSASWSNNGEYLPCPGNLNDISGGYADHFDQVVIEGNILINQPGLLTIPAQEESSYYAIFGKYPPFTVQTGDHFQAVLACADQHTECDVDFSLEYFNTDNTVSQVPGAKWNKKFDPEGTYIYADANLESLAGKTVQFLLTVRDNGTAADDYAVWIMPHIARLSAGTDAIPPNQLDLTTVEQVQVLGVVDMSSAPPYLYDDHPPGSQSTVVLFDLNSEKFYSVSNQPEDLSFSMDVYPGQYYALAFSYGIGDIPYVTGAYTGNNPSCGQAMAVLNVLPDTPVKNLSINDWNWSCGGTAERLEKPEEVSLP